MFGDRFSFLCPLLRPSVVPPSAKSIICFRSPRRPSVRPFDQSPSDLIRSACPVVVVARSPRAFINNAHVGKREGPHSPRDCRNKIGPKWFMSDAKLSDVASGQPPFPFLSRLLLPSILALCPNYQSGQTELSLARSSWRKRATTTSFAAAFFARFVRPSFICPSSNPERVIRPETDGRIEASAKEDILLLLFSSLSRPSTK